MNGDQLIRDAIYLGLKKERSTKYIPEGGRSLKLLYEQVWSLCTFPHRTLRSSLTFLLATSLRKGVKGAECRDMT